MVDYWVYQTTLFFLLNGINKSRRLYIYKHIYIVYINIYLFLTITINQLIVQDVLKFDFFHPEERLGFASTQIWSDGPTRPVSGGVQAPDDCWFQFY